MNNSPRYNASNQIDLLCPSLRVDPFPTYSEWRKLSPVIQLDPDDYLNWLICGYDAAKSVYQNYNIFSNKQGSRLMQPNWMGDDDYFRPYPLLFDDPPRHTLFRQAISKKKLTKEMRKHIAWMRELANDLLINVGSKEENDFLAKFIYPYIGLTINRLMGIGDGDYEQRFKWIRLLEIPEESPSSKYIYELKVANERNRKLFLEMVESKNSTLPKSILMSLLKISGEHDSITNVDIADLVELLTLAGYQGTAQFFCHALIQLANRPEVMVRLKESPGKIVDFIEEALRFNSSIHYQFRRTTRSVVVSNTTIPEGACIYINVAAANHDPAHFSDPDSFNIDRNNLKDQLAFGYGIHNCLGAELARILIKEALEVILSQVETISCPPIEKLPWFFSFFAHGVTQLPITFSLETQ